jgi:hypothetical protein
MAAGSSAGQDMDTQQILCRHSHRYMQDQGTSNGGQERQRSGVLSLANPSLMQHPSSS